MTPRGPIAAALTLLTLMILAVGPVPAPAQPRPTPARLDAVTVSAEPGRVIVALKISGPATYRSELIDTPTRLVIDLDETTYAWRTTPLVVGTEPVKQIRGSQYRKGVARVVVELTRSVSYIVREDASGLAIVLAPRNAGGAADEPARAPVKAGFAGATVTPAPDPVARRPADGARTESAPVRIAQAPAPPPPPPATGPRLISLDFKDADVVNLLRILAAESSKNIVLGEDVKGKMSITLRNVPWELALDTILVSRGLQKVEKDNVIRIVSAEQLAKEREALARVEEAKLKSEADLRTKIADAQLKEQEAQARKVAAEAAVAEAQARGPLKEETIRLSYADPEEVAKTLQGILGIPAEGIQASSVPISAAPPAEPPFSALYGTGPPPPPARPVSPSADVLAKGITIRAHKPTNSLFIRHYATDLERIKTLIREKLDIPLPQVKIEARMEILRREDLFAIGVQWGGGGVSNSSVTVVGRGFTADQTTSGGIGPFVRDPAFLTNKNLTLTGALPVSATTGLPTGGNLVNLPIASLSSLTGAGAGAGGFAFGIIGSRLNLNLALEALKSESKTRTLARPEIVTVENAKATMSLGEEIPYATVSSAGTSYSFKEAVLKLEVTPTVIREGDVTKIKMKVVVENNSRGSIVALGGTLGSPPAIDKRRAETEVLIKEGDRLVIGGATKGTSITQTRKIPLFGDIPLLGWLFKQTGNSVDETELVVFITPSVLKTDADKTVPSQTGPPKQP